VISRPLLPSMRTGLIGLRPQNGNEFTLAPLTDRNWKCYALEDVPYHGHLLTILYDHNGDRYRMGRGWTTLQDGKVISRSKKLPMSVHLQSDQTLNLSGEEFD
jgi:hypothetical protein